MTALKCGPETCPLTAWAALSPSERKAQRKSLAEQLYKQGFTMEQIGEQFGVTQQTISNDLENYKELVNQKHAKTARNPKGSGRPKGNNRKRRAKLPSHKKIVHLAESGVSKKEISSEVGLGERMVDRVLEIENKIENARHEIYAELLGAAGSEHFSEKGALRIEDAIRIHKLQLNKAFEQQVNDEVRRRIAAADDATRAQNKQLRAENDSLSRMLQRQRIFVADEYKTIIRCLHPDANPSSEIRHKAFLLFEPKKFALTGEK